MKVSTVGKQKGRESENTLNNSIPFLVTLSLLYIPAKKNLPIYNNTAPGALEKIKEKVCGGGVAPARSNYVL